MTRRTMTRYTKRRGKILSRYLRILGVNLILWGMHISLSFSPIASATLTPLDYGNVGYGETIINVKIIDFKNKKNCRDTWHWLIFPESSLPSIFSAITFHNWVRDGSKWFHYAKIPRFLHSFNNKALTSALWYLNSSIRFVSIPLLNTLLYFHMVPIKRLVLP